jgi:replication fork protection complex subunit Csm3/Swi3
MVRCVLTINLQFSDVAWLLGTYQVWLHELYPRAKFADGLAMIEKLGHGKRMQKLRCGWIDESKPKKAQENDSDHEHLSVTPQPGLEANPSPRQSNLETPDIISVPAAAEALSTENEKEPAITARANGQGDTDNISFTGAPNDDELDQLLAEEPMSNANPSRNSSTSAVLLNAENSHVDEEDVFANEEEIMRELDFA